MRLAVLGSTGSIGRQTLDVVRALPGCFEIIGLAAGRNSTLLAKQIEEFHPRFVSFAGEAGLIPGDFEVTTPETIAGSPEVDTVLVATSGKAGLAPTLSALRAGKTVALANKEVLVMAGGIVTRLAKEHGARLLPVDSEHSAIWQCLESEKNKPAKIVLTASGGPFINYSKERLATVTPEQALRHPSWKMGKKVTVDSATLMNKGLEVIEAHWLFDMSYEQIEVVVHPQSIIHSMVEFADGALKAQLSYPDMRLPIQYALTYPERVFNPGLPRLDWRRVENLNFGVPDYDRFPCLKLAIEAGRRGGTYPAALSAADEVAVELFLAGRIGFMEIPALVEKTMGRHRSIGEPDIEQIMAADEWARAQVLSLTGEGGRCC